MMYGEAFTVDESVMHMDFVEPIGKARIMREGTHVTLVSFARGVKLCLEAAESLEK